MSERFGQDCEEAARLHHLTWCHDPLCVHIPFPADRELATAILRTAEPVYRDREVLIAGAHALMTLNAQLRTELVRLDDLRDQLARHHAALGAMIP